MNIKKIETDQEHASKTFGLATQGGPAFAKAFSQSPVAQAAVADLDGVAVPEDEEGRRSAFVRALHRERARIKMESALDD